MPLLLAYWGVIAIWSTTPLGIAASNDSLSSWSAAGVRLLIALPLVLTVVAIRRRPFFASRRVVLCYFVASLAFTPQMSLVYWAAQSVPTGVISIVFALSPCLTYLASLLFLRDNRVTPLQAGSLCVAFMGMGVIYYDQLTVLGPDAASGLMALLLSVTIFATCTVWLKRLTADITIDPFCQTGGTMLFALPGFALCWYLFDGELPTQFSGQSLMGIGYLATFGSVLGFSLYFYIMRHMNVVTVSLVTLITPLFAIGIGTLFLDEPLSWRMLAGSSLVLGSLLTFEGVLPRLVRRIRQLVWSSSAKPAVDETVVAVAETEPQ